MSNTHHQYETAKCEAKRNKNDKHSTSVNIMSIR